MIATGPHNQAAQRTPREIRQLTRTATGRVHPGDTEGYRAWARQDDPGGGAAMAAEATTLDHLSGRRLLSVLLLPDGSPQSRSAWATLDSLLPQTYPTWEAWLPPGTHPTVTDQRLRTLEPPAREDSVGWFQRVVQTAAGEYLVPLPAYALLTPAALLEIAMAILESHEADLIYTDEDSVDAVGARMAPRFKPGWDPELMLGRDLVAHVAAYRAERIRAVAAEQTWEGSVDALLYDLALRIGSTSDSKLLYHIPRVLCSVPFDIREAQGVDGSLARQTVAEHLARQGNDGVAVVAPDRAPAWTRIIWPVPTPAPRATVIVPTRDQVAMLARCVEGVLERTEYPDLELLIVDNGSNGPETIALLRTLEADTRVRVMRHEAPFNFSELINLAAQEASGEVLVLLNDDTEVIDSGWLRELVSQALRPEVGVVGARLLYPDGTIQHAGIILQDGAPHHQFRLSDAAELGPFGELALTRSVSAVTGACLAVRRSVFEEVGGLDEALAVSFGDVDLCLRVSERGYRVICTPFAELYHHESVTRGYEDTPEKRARMARELEVLRGRWGTALRKDRFANPNLLFTWDESGAWGLPRPADRPADRRDTPRMAPARNVTGGLPLVRRVRARLAVVMPNPLFSSAWYVAAYPELGSYRFGPYRHYRRHGVAEGRNPNRLFDTRWYLERYPDVAASGMDPLDHYLRHGASEGRDPSPDFSTRGYLDTHPGVRESGENPLLHCLRHGGG